MRGVGTGGDGVEFAAYYFLRKAGGAESFVIWDASIGGVEVEVGGEESRGLSSKTEQGELVEMANGQMQVGFMCLPVLNVKCTN